MKRRLVIALLIACAGPGSTAPRFVPNAKQTFPGFVAINPPRADVPVGALWIEKFGPTGEAATPDNLETIRSLSGLTIDRNLQLSVTIGLFDLIGIEPRLRDHVSARFTDLSIVRVRDPVKLSGPPGEPRLMEALKAGTITVSTDGEVGLNARAGFRAKQIDGTMSNVSSRVFSIEGRDMFIAVKVARTTLTRSPERRLHLEINVTEGRARIDDFELISRAATCPIGSPPFCVSRILVGVVKLSSYPVTEPAKFVPLDENGEAKLALPLPITDGKGGLFRMLVLRSVRSCYIHKARDCDVKNGLFVHYEGDRTVNLKVDGAFTR